MEFKKSAGFSLVGLAMIMILIGVGLSILPLLSPNLETIGREQTVSILHANKNAVMGYAMANGQLPSLADYPKVVPSLKDGYQNPTGYAFDSRLMSSKAICATPLTPPFKITVDTLGNTVAVAFVIWSKGRNGVVNATPPPIKVEGSIATDNTLFPNPPPSPNVDDLLEWVTLDELKKNVGCEGLESKSTLNIVADALPVGRVNESYPDVKFTPLGGSGSGYQWCVETDSSTNKLSFPPTVPIIANCTGAIFTAGDSLIMNIAPPGPEDISFDGHPIRLFLQDGYGNAVNRLFKWVVLATTHLAQNYSLEFLQTIQRTLTPEEDVDVAKNASPKIGVVWSEATRFTVTQGTVTDHLTGLVWLRQADCYPGSDWTTALNQANNLSSGQCGLSDGSGVGMWRLPNRKELSSLLDLGRENPALPNDHPFLNPQFTNYWTSTTASFYTDKAFMVSFANAA
ncbi:DUF1566 domain-containing protein, partial [Candidatus Magnetaquicoccus inordinatus]|uniref:Lcl C-terminal domain-containing protein n=1 Tax=Candidatus Magnetaquicoccus inordinatus TaxID=2496818 RepID=UPI00102B2E42